MKVGLKVKLSIIFLRSVDTRGLQDITKDGGKGVLEFLFYFMIVIKKNY